MAAVTCIGESHMACVLVAAEESGTELIVVPLKDAVNREYLRAGGSADRKRSLQSRSSPAFRRKALERLRGTICSFIGGRYPMALTLHRHPRPFDLVLREQPELPIEPEAEIVPVEAMRAVLEKGAQQSLQMLEKIVEAAKGNVYHFESPPPVGESSMLKMGSAQPFVRYKLWRLHSEIVREYSERVGAQFVPRPDKAVDDSGFLRPEYCLTSTHANAAYGALILEQIAALQ
jgi:hypothetical protein